MIANSLVVGDKSDHGGMIITGDPIMTINGKPCARIGDLHSCPQFYPTVPPIPHAVTPIIAAANVSTRTMINGRPAAVGGDITGCGARLRASYNLMGMVAIGSLAIAGFSVAAALIKGNRTRYAEIVTGIPNVSNPNQLTDQQVNIIKNKVEVYQNLYNKIVAPISELPPSPNQNCDCK